MTSKTPHSDLFLNKLSDSSKIKLDGSSLTLAQIVAVSRSFAKFELDQETREVVQESENVLKGAVKDGKTVYVSMILPTMSFSTLSAFGLSYAFSLALLSLSY